MQDKFQELLHLHEHNHSSYISISQPYLFNFSELPIAAIAYELVKEIYLWFGILEEGIPYTKIENGIRIIDIQKIIAQR